MARVTIVDDPLRIVVRAFRNLYPMLSARIVIQPIDGNKLGEACFAPGRVPLVSVDPMQSYVGCIDVLAHELAHVSTEGHGHGPRWKSSYKAISNEYHRIVTARCEAAGVESVALRPKEASKNRPARAKSPLQGSEK